MLGSTHPAQEIYEATDRDRLRQRVSSVLQSRHASGTTWMHRCSGVRFTWERDCKSLIIRKSDQGGVFEVLHDLDGDWRARTQKLLDMHRVLRRYPPPLRELAALLVGVGLGLILKVLIKVCVIYPHVTFFPSQVPFLEGGVLLLCLAIAILLYRYQHASRVIHRPVRYEYSSATYGYLMEQFNVPAHVAAWVMQEANEGLSDCSETYMNPREAGTEINLQRLTMCDPNTKRLFITDQLVAITVEPKTMDGYTHHFHLLNAGRMVHHHACDIVVTLGEDRLQYRATLKTENTLKIRGARLWYSLWDYADRRLTTHVVASKAHVCLPTVTDERTTQARAFLVHWFQTLGYQPLASVCDVPRRAEDLLGSPAPPHPLSMKRTPLTPRRPRRRRWPVGRSPAPIYSPAPPPPALARSRSAPS